MGGSYPKLNNREYLKERIEYTFYDPKSATPELIDEVIGIVNDRLKVLQIISMSKSAMKHNLKEELHQLKKPVGLIWGKNDTITPPEVAHEFNELIEDSTVYFIDKCGHAPMMEQPEEFNIHFDDFLASLKERV
jgi:pimeloyl-ACP methyl ester carboxylesterase